MKKEKKCRLCVQIVCTDKMNEKKIEKEIKDNNKKEKENK